MKLVQTRRRFIIESVVSIAAIFGYKQVWASSVGIERIDVLWKVFLAIAKRWELLSEENVIGLRVSWETWIRERDQNSVLHSAAYTEVVELTRSKEELIEKVLKAEVDTTIEVREVVILEFARFLLSHDGFSQFGYSNYRGYYGGSVDLASSFRRYIR